MTVGEDGAAVLWCPACPEVAWSAATPTWRCDSCGLPLELREPLRVDPARLPVAAPEHPDEPGLWRYREWLPPVGAPVTLGEPRTPLLEARVGGRPVVLKRESALPTGSFKDRGSAVLAAWLRASGIRRVVEDSSGNAGASLAAYGVAAGLETRIVVPASASAAKLLQVRMTGVAVEAIGGPRSAATDRALELAGAGWFYASHLWSPVFLAGAATFAWELWEQLGRRVPDAIVVPVGGGTLLLGLSRGFGALHEAGLIPREPRLYGVQATACDPLARTFRASREVVEAVTPGPSMGEGILLGDPPRGAEIVRVVRGTGGAIVAVADDASWAALDDLARQGTFVEPTSAVAVAGCAALVADGRIVPDDLVVLGVTGAGLKATDRVLAHRGM